MHAFLSFFGTSLGLRIRLNHRNLIYFSDDLHESKEALADATRRFHELEIELRRVEGERDDWRLAYQDAESLRKQEEAKVIRLTAENQQIRMEYERRLHDKEEEYEAMR